MENQRRKRIILGTVLPAPLGVLGLLTALSLHRILDKSGADLNILLTGTLAGMLVGTILRRHYRRFPPH